MNQPQLPAYLLNRKTSGVTERAAAGLGTVMPPHISIQGGTFTLIDAAGNEQNGGNALLACIVDVSDQNAKRYYAEKWKPDSKDPPLCWSSNGIGPSIESSKPQSPTCADCEWNRRGSAVSAISGTAIKACRDEKWLALLLPQYPQVLFQMIITPGSFKNWQAFVEPFKKAAGTDLSDCLVEIAFVPRETGTLQFQAKSYIDEQVFGLREQALLSRATDALVGRNDVPIRSMLPKPAQEGGISAVAVTHPGSNYVPPQQSQAALPSQEQRAAPFPAPVAASFAGPSPAEASIATNMTAPSGTTETQRRTRRTRAQIDADNAAQAAQPGAAAPAPAQPAPAMAPFRPAAPAGAPAAAGPSFGIQPGVAPDEALNNTLNSLFAPRQ